MSKEESKESNESNESKNNYNDEINLFYATKEKYKSIYDAKVDKILKNKNIDNKSKREKVKNIVLPCIFCKRKVNSIFSRNNHTLKITCGSESEPCSNKFELKLAYYSSMNNILDGLEETIQKMKDSVIHVKSKLLYDYISQEEALEEFNKTNKSLNEYIEVYLSILKKRDLITNNEEQQHLILQKRNIIDEYILLNNDLLERYKEEKTDDSLNNFIENTIQILMPINKELFELKNAFQEITQQYEDNSFVNEETNNKNKKIIYILHTRNNLFEHLENIFDDVDNELIQNDL